MQTFNSETIIVIAADDVKPLMTGNEMNSTRNPIREEFLHHSNRVALPLVKFESAQT
jgi:hypothetical protein